MPLCLTDLKVNRSITEALRLILCLVMDLIGHLLGQRHNQSLPGVLLDLWSKPSSNLLLLYLLLLLVMVMLALYYCWYYR